MKINLEQAQQLLEKLGIQDVTLVTNEGEQTDEINIDEIASAAIEKVAPKGEISDEEKQQIIAAAVGRVHGEYRSAFANAIGMKTKELEELKLDSKGLAAKVRETIDSRYSAKQEELGRQVEELTKQLNSKESELDEKISEIEKSWQSRFQERDTKDYLQGILGKIPKSGNTSKQTNLFLKDLQEQYDVRYDPTTKEARLYIKNSDDLVMDGKNPLSLEKIAQDWVKEMGFAVNDTSNVPPAQVNNDGAGANFAAGVQNVGKAMGVAEQPANIDPAIAGLRAEILASNQ